MRKRVRSRAPLGPVLIASSRTRSGVALFTPRVTVVVVAAALPVTRLVALREADAREPLGALPEVEVGHDAAYGRPVRATQRLPVELEGHQRVGSERLPNRNVRGVTMGRLEHDVPRRRLRTHLRRELAQPHALETGSEH